MFGAAFLDELQKLAQAKPKADPEHVAKLLKTPPKDYKKLLAGLLKRRGESRADMPQIGGPVLEPFLASLRRTGVKVRRESVKASKLKPSQKHLDNEKVKKIVGEINAGTMKAGAIIVARDYTILDGHHRWAGYHAISPDSKVDIIRIDLSFAGLVGRARAFDGAKFKTLKGKAA